MGKRNAFEYKKDIHPHKTFYDFPNENNFRVENNGWCVYPDGHYDN
jgi:hypothetical protein